MNDTMAYSIRSLKHAYTGEVVLNIPRLDIPSGQIYGLVGPNGSGKTTLLSILALLTTPLSGDVILFGAECTRSRNRRQLRRQVTLIHQKPVLFSTTVRNNISFGLRAQGLPAKEIQTRVDAALHELELSSLAERNARKLSGGEAQRVALARGLVLQTPIVLFDEPTNSLDTTFHPLVIELVRKANESRGTTVIIASHDPGCLSALGERIIRLPQPENQPRFP